MSTAAELLEQIAQRLDSLPDRLAGVLATGADPGSGRARSSAPGGKGKSPSLWNASENLFGAIGGQHAQTLVDSSRKISDAWSGWKDAWRGPEKQEKQSAMPSAVQGRKTMLSGSAMPSVMNKTQLATGASQQSSPSLSGPAGQSGDLLAVMKDLAAKIQTLGERIEAMDGDSSEQSQHAPEVRGKSIWEAGDEGRTKRQQSGQQDGHLGRLIHAPVPVQRPAQHVPGANEAVKGKS